MKKIIFLIALTFVVKFGYSQTVVNGSNLKTIEHPGFREYIKSSTTGDYEIGCNVLITAVCYTTESVDPRFGQTINLNNHNGPIEPSMKIKIIANPELDIEINLCEKNTSIENPAYPLIIKHVFIQY